MKEDVENVVRLMSQVVARDGGKLALAGYDQADGRIEVSYAPQPNPECETCSFTTEMIEAFLKESLRSHGISADKLIVNEVAA